MHQTSVLGTCGRQNAHLSKVLGTFGWCNVQNSVLGTLDLLGFARLCLAELGFAWVCLGLLGFCGLLGFASAFRPGAARSDTPPKAKIIQKSIKVITSSMKINGNSIKSKKVKGTSVKINGKSMNIHEKTMNISGKSMENK